jgi:hypothetical protein
MVPGSSLPCMSFAPFCAQNTNEHEQTKQKIKQKLTIFATIAQSFNF